MCMYICIYVCIYIVNPLDRFSSCKLENRVKPTGTPVTKRTTVDRISSCKTENRVKQRNTSDLTKFVALMTNVHNPISSPHESR